MSIRRDPRNGGWFFRATAKRADGVKVRIFGTPGVPGPYQDLPNTKIGAQAAEDRAKAHALTGTVPAGATPAPAAAEKEVLTFREWFNGRFWDEWVVAERNKPSEQEAKRSAFRTYLDPVLGGLTLDRIRAAEIQRLRAHLVAAKLGEKRINNVMAVLSKALRYARDVELISDVPRIRFRRVERPAIEAWTLDEYPRVLVAAREESREWFVAACLAGEAGLRVGEIRALRWREDVDLVARTVTVNQQSWKGHEGTPKGRTRRTIPMTDTLYQALKSLEVVRTGYVVRNLDGTAVRDAQTSHATYRMCRRAGLPERGWHVLRHSFGTHSARFGVNPWQLMEWMGHKRIDETMGYVHMVERQPRPIPDEIVQAGQGHTDPSARVLAMLGARAPRPGSHVAASRVATITSEVITAS